MSQAVEVSVVGMSESQDSWEVVTSMTLAGTSVEVEGW